MSPDSRRYLMALLVVVSYLAYRMIEVHLDRKAPFLPQCTRHEVANHYQNDFIHQAESCTIEQSSNDDGKQSVHFLKISCIAKDLPHINRPRLNSHSHKYGRNILLYHQRLSHPNKIQWNFRVPKEAVNGLGIILT